MIFRRKAPTSAGPSTGRKPPQVGASHDRRGSDHLQRTKSVVHSNSSSSSAHGDHGDPSKCTVTQNVAPQSHLRRICCFQQHHADHPGALCYQGHLRSPTAGGFMQRCHACNRQFGLIRHRWWGYHFCKKTCLNDFLAKRSQQIGRMKDWLGSSQAPAREPSRL
jgi:hypothetical protein